MRDYELTFIVDPMTDELEDVVMDNFDALLGHNHIGDTFITLTSSGTNAVAAAKNAHMRLLGLGVVIQRLEYDLADRSQIAERLGMTRQAIGNYIRGARQAAHPFPRAFNETGPVWLWADIVEWTRRAIETDPADGLGLPNRREIAEFNACIDREYAPEPASIESGYGHFKVPVSTSVDVYDYMVGTIVKHRAFGPGRPLAVRWADALFAGGGDLSSTCDVTFGPVSRFGVDESIAIYSPEAEHVDL